MRNISGTTWTPSEPPPAASDGARLLYFGRRYYEGITDREVKITENFSLMKDQVIIANAGHFQREVDVPALLALSDSREEIVPKITSYRLKSGKQLFLISDANLVNLSAGNGNPIEVMDLGLALQTLSLERIALDSKSLRAIPQPVPFDIEMNVAELACKHWINH
ncbi:TPA_asm: hypothetical protein G0G79_05880 [Salmonella enterica]|nr:hypothetical protein [Salmonella enterica]HAC8264276.1 hypothetical protein [Salmonella enterica]